MKTIWLAATAFSLALANPAHAAPRHPKASPPRSTAGGLLGLQGGGSGSSLGLRSLGAPDDLGGPVHAPAPAPRFRPLADVPTSGLDPDLQAALDAARAQVATQPAQAVQRVLDLQLSPDRFTTAQREQLRAPTVELLHAAAQASRSPAQTAQALDAAWVLSGKPKDPQVGAALASYAQQLSSPAESLWVARRALEADPSNALAQSLDEKLSENRYKTLGYSLLGAAVVGTVAALVFYSLGKSADAELTGSVHSRAEADALISKRKTDGLIATVGLGLGIGGYLGGVGLITFGNPHYQPTSPANLPALPEAR